MGGFRVIGGDGASDEFVIRRRSKLFYWDTAIDAQVRTKFYFKATKKYKDWVCKVKARRLTKGRPTGVSKVAWATLCSYWDSKAAQEISHKVKKNRLANVDGLGRGPSIHKGGSRSVAALAQERGVPIAETLDTFYRMYHVDDEHYTDPKAARIGEVDEIVAERSQPLPDGRYPPPLPVETASHYSSAISPSVLVNLPEVRELTSQLQASQIEQEKLLQKIHDLEAKQMEAEVRQMEGDALQAVAVRLTALIDQLQAGQHAEVEARQTKAKQMRKQLEETQRAHQLVEEEHRRDKTRHALMWEQLYRRLTDRDGLP
ncbi:hypothetical protein C2S51_019175 [Perilla frutescens var. frutescens]|nr:hypothetical protein C2S51_019175 [Perilla frutescens var. frutescens]